MEPLQRFQKWIQQTLFGSEEKQGETKVEASKQVQQPKQIDKRKSVHTYPSYQEPSDSAPRITYQYAKSNGIRYSDEIEEQAKEMMQDRKIDEVTSEKTNEDKQPEKPNQSNRLSKSTTTEETKKERVKFNNPDFKPTAIPSPIHGFRKVLPSQRTQLTLHKQESGSNSVDETKNSNEWTRDRQKEHNRKLENDVLQKLRKASPVPPVPEFIETNEKNTVDTVEAALHVEEVEQTQQLETHDVKGEATALSETYELNEAKPVQQVENEVHNNSAEFVLIEHEAEQAETEQEEQVDEIQETEDQLTETVETEVQTEEISNPNEPVFIEQESVQAEAEQEEQVEEVQETKDQLTETVETEVQTEEISNPPESVLIEQESVQAETEQEEQVDEIQETEDQLLETVETEVQTEEISNPPESVFTEQEPVETEAEQEEQVEEIQNTEEQLIEQNEDVSLVEEDPPFYEEEIIEEVNVQQDIPQQNEAIKTKPKNKPSVPFNVLMMPKDKKAATSTVQSKKIQSGYKKPGIQLLRFPEAKRATDTEWLDQQAVLLEETLQSFHVDAKVVNTTMGPSVTRYEIQPARGVKVNKVTNLSDDIKMALSAKEIRIEAPIPGKNTIGIEVPNLHPEAVWLREILRRDVFIQPSSPMTVALGLDISGQPIVTDLRKMPHGLVAGATGSGKSVCINSILISLLYKASPDEVKLLLVDPKMVELAPYNDVPHLVAPVITDAKQATIALKWVVGEMERRYEQFSQKGVRDVSRYNELYSEDPDKPAMPYILVVIDELADLMMVSPQEVEDSICRIAQKARACGIHLLVATQRPSVDVITGLIKANIPTRIAFSVSSQTDSRTILDMNGAERLLGRGDMLFNENGSPKPVRVQGTFVTDEEIEDVIAYVKKQRKPEFLLDTEQLQKTFEQSEQEDDLFEEACYHVINQGNASASNLQRRFRIGYNRAARLIDMLEARGVITGAMGSKPRQVLIDEMSVDKVLGYTD